MKERPFRAPHYNASMNSLVGGGNFAKPGEISLAHNGVLFLDEIAEFNKKTLESLRQPMEDRIVTISRVRYTHSYPANFMFIAAMNPCPCGYYGEERCHCTDYEVLKYRSKISGPILDRIDIQKCVQPVNFMDLKSYKEGRSSKELREIVEKGRKIQVDSEYPPSTPPKPEYYSPKTNFKSTIRFSKIPTFISSISVYISGLRATPIFHPAANLDNLRKYISYFLVVMAYIFTPLK